MCEQQVAFHSVCDIYRPIIKESADATESLLQCLFLAISQHDIAD